MIFYGQSAGLSIEKPIHNKMGFSNSMAGTTRLELATSGVTGRRSNQN
jgi:hypothetical protein